MTSTQEAATYKGSAWDQSETMDAESRTIANLQFSKTEWKALQPLLKHLEYNDVNDMVDMAYEDVVEGCNNEIAKQLAFPLFKTAMARKLLAEHFTEDPHDATE